MVGEGTLESWLTGFDLTPVSTGSLKLWEFYRDFNKNGTTYSLLFKAPANVLSQHGDNFTFNIGVSSYYHGYTFKTQQVIDINMPATTEVKTASPTDMSLLKGNTATFLLFTGDTYPSQFSVTSGPSTKSLGEIALENASLWFLAPGGWAAIGSLIVLSFTGLRAEKYGSETSSTITSTRAWSPSTIYTPKTLQNSTKKWTTYQDPQSKCYLTIE